MRLNQSYIPVFVLHGLGCLISLMSFCGSDSSDGKDMRFYDRLPECTEQDQFC